MRENIGPRIKEARNSKGWSQTKLAKQLGFKDGNNALISRWESGKIYPEESTLTRLAALLEQPVAWFYSGGENSTEAADPEDFVGLMAAAPVERWAEVFGTNAGTALKLAYCLLAVAAGEAKTVGDAAKLASDGGLGLERDEINSFFWRLTSNSDNTSMIVLELRIMIENRKTRALLEQVMEKLERTDLANG